MSRVTITFFCRLAERTITQFGQEQKPGSKTGSRRIEVRRCCGGMFVHDHIVDVQSDGTSGTIETRMVDVVDLNEITIED